MTGEENIRIGVIGAGSWGTTLANLLAEKGYAVDLWVREKEVYHQIKEERINRLFLPDMKLVRKRSWLDDGSIPPLPGSLEPDETPSDTRNRTYVRDERHRKRHPIHDVAGR
jgi:cation diffusion facilitator CzcD-associated flavoprotein CzcO